MKQRAAFVLGAVLILTPSAHSQKSSYLTVSFPGKDWAIRIPASGFKVEINEVQQKSRKYVLAKNEKIGVTISVMLERGSQPATSQECRDSASRRPKQAGTDSVTDIGIHDVGPFSVAEFTIGQVGGFNLNQRNIFACLAKEDIYADVHISKMSFRPSEEGLLMAYVEGAEIIDKTGEVISSGPTSLDYFKEGTLSYEKNDYKNAIDPYQKAFDLEKQNPKLGQTLWRVLLDNLATAYGITGDLKNSRDVITYGMSKDPTYPLFYYNMACVYAESKDLENTMANLKKAFQYKQNMITGETMPNPRTDDSFQGFMHTKEFLDLLDSLEHSPTEVSPPNR